MGNTTENKDVSTPNLQSDRLVLGVSTQRECQPSHLKADRRESGDGKRFGLDRDLPQLDKLSCRTLRFFGGFLYLYNMKLLSVLRSLIVEDRITLGSFENEGDVFNIVATNHTQIANNPISLKSRPDFEDLGDVVFEFDDIISNVAKDVIVNRKKDSIFVRDNWNGFDFIIYPHYDEGEYKLNIATAIKHPQKLNIKNQNTLIIITSNGDTLIKEQFKNNNFTKIVKGDIILYII